MHKNIKIHEEKNRDIKIRDWKAIFKFYVLRTLHDINTYYRNNGLKERLKLDQKYMQELNNCIIDDLKDLLDEDDSELIGAKKEYDFILKHNDISDEYFNDLSILNKGLRYQ